jgi:hypothetical protein
LGELGLAEQVLSDMVAEGLQMHKNNMKRDGQMQDEPQDNDKQSLH